MGAGGCAANDRFLARVELDFSLVSSVARSTEVVVRQRVPQNMIVSGAYATYQRHGLLKDPHFGAIKHVQGR
jgi:hypothetical protein